LGKKGLGQLKKKKKRIRTQRWMREKTKRKTMNVALTNMILRYIEREYDRSVGKIRIPLC
jgi:hypothetical protein